MALAGLLLHYSLRVFVCDSFVVNGVSMEPVLHSGERVWVNKLKMGARIYTDYNWLTCKVPCLSYPKIL